MSLRPGDLRLQRSRLDDPRMDKRDSHQGRARLRPLDHLRPGEHALSREPVDGPPPDDPASAETIGKATRPAGDAEPREHVEGAEQGPA